MEKGNRNTWHQSHKIMTEHLALQPRQGDGETKRDWMEQVAFCSPVVSQGVSSKGSSSFAPSPISTRRPELRAKVYFSGSSSRRSESLSLGSIGSAHETVTMYSPGTTPGRVPSGTVVCISKFPSSSTIPATR